MRIRVQQPTVEKTKWDGARISLRWFREGAPVNPIGTYRGIVLTVGRLLEGEVLMRKNGCEVRAKRGEWVVCHPGERYQRFSDSARLLSLHFHVESPSNAARWAGEPLVKCGNVPRLNQSVERLRRARILRTLKTEGRLNPEAEPASLDAMLEMRERAMAFFRVLMQAIEPLGMHFEASPIHDARVRESRLRLATADLRQGLLRVKLAGDLGLSASQLDRLWVRELGETPRHYWNLRRLEAACALLLEHRMGKEVAYETGFRHLSQFSLWFHTNMGESPSEFQERHQ